MRYLIGDTPNHIVVFKYGQRLTQKRYQKACETLLDFATEHYDIPEEHATLERTRETLKTRFTQKKDFELTSTGYRAENISSANTEKDIEIFDIR